MAVRARRPAAGHQCDELRQGRARRAGAVVVRRRPHAVPRIRPRPARAVVGRDLPDDFRHPGGDRFRRTALAALRALAGAARRAAPVRPPLPDRRADAGGPAGTLIAARSFNQGFATVEYVASAMVDLAFHLAPEPENIDPAAFEADVLAQIGMPAEIGMRHRSPHFLHVFSGGGYAAGYYSYMWSEVLDADAFEAFGRPATCSTPPPRHGCATIFYAAGGSRDPDDAYRAFRGRLPTPGRAVTQARLCRGRRLKAAQRDTAVTLSYGGCSKLDVGPVAHRPHRHDPRGGPRFDGHRRGCGSGCGSRPAALVCGFWLRSSSAWSEASDCSLPCCTGSRP